MKKIVVADDHEKFRHGLVEQIEKDHSFSVIGETGNGDEALEMIKNLKPDIALLDIRMPGKSGLVVTGKSKEEGAETDIIIITMYKEERYFNKAMELGVKGYLLKENSVEDLTPCLKAVAEGKNYITPLLAEYEEK